MTPTPYTPGMLEWAAAALIVGMILFALWLLITDDDFR